MKILIFVLTILLLAAPCTASIITVDPNGSADFTTIQDAIDESGNGDTIEVRPGVYYERLNFYGNAIMITGTDPNNINTVYATVVDGGLSGNTVTFDSGEDENSIITGLTIQNGDKGIYCYYSDPLISRCVIRYAKSYGIHGSNSSPAIYDCIIRENGSAGVQDCDGPITRSTVSDNGKDAGIVGCDGPIMDCIVTENEYGGLESCSGSISGCIVTGNLNYGFDNCNGQIVNCTISGNTYAGLGQCRCHAVNCTIIGNKGSGFSLHASGEATLVNNIIAQNWNYGISTSSSNTNLKYNNVWGNLSGNYYGAIPGTTDTHENPLFAVDGYWDKDDNWVEGEYHLKSIAGRWDPNDQMWVNDEATSPCVDAGEPAGGYFYEPVPNGGRINQGAYGGTIYASKSPYGPEPYCTKYIPGDANGDCRINFADFAIMSSYWLDCNLEPPEACWE